MSWRSPARFGKIAEMWAIVPLKSLDAAKSRLARVLAPDQRRELTLRMACDVLRVASREPGIRRILICSPAREAAALGRRFGAFVYQDEISTADLNDALCGAARHALRQGAQELTVLPADLPALDAEDLRRFLAHHASLDAAAVTIATDRHGTGTNVLAWRPAQSFAPAFGPGSAQRHERLARELGVRASRCDLPTAMLDIDTVSDLRQLVVRHQHPDRRDESSETLRYLRESGLLGRFRETRRHAA
jgi:2-phospho-L-lactate/phosphoenolpyruvate guanylyltransferase